MKINLTVCADNIRTVWTVVLRRKCVGRHPLSSSPASRLRHAEHA